MCCRKFHAHWFWSWTDPSSSSSPLSYPSQIVHPSRRSKPIFHPFRCSEPVPSKHTNVLVNFLSSSTFSLHQNLRVSSMHSKLLAQIVLSSHLSECSSLVVQDSLLLSWICLVILLQRFYPLNVYNLGFTRRSLSNHSDSFSEYIHTWISRFAEVSKAHPGKFPTCPWVSVPAHNTWSLLHLISRFLHLCHWRIVRQFCVHDQWMQSTTPTK